MNNIGEIDKEAEVKSYLSTYNHCSDDLRQKQSILSTKISVLNTANSDL